MLGASQRDVGQAQVLATLLDHVLVEVALERPPLEPDVDRVLVPGRRIVESHRLLRPDPRRIPQERAVDDRELEALAAVDRQHLDRLGVGLEPPRPLLLALVALGVGDALGEPAAQRGSPEPLGARRPVEQLGEVAEVGQLALAVADREHPGGEVLADHDRLEQRGDAAVAQDPAPAVKAPVHVLPLLVGRGREPFGAPTRGTASARRSWPGSARRDARAPRAGPASRAPARVANTLPAPLITAGTRASSQLRRGRAPRCYASARAPRCAGGRSAPALGVPLGARCSIVAPEDSSATTSAARSSRDVLAGRAGAGVAVVGLVDRRIRRGGRPGCGAPRRSGAPVSRGRPVRRRRP